VKFNRKKQLTMTPIPLDTSVQGAYDLAIEASGVRIHLITRDGVSIGSSGGYSTDGESSVASSSRVDITVTENPMVDCKSSSLTDVSSTSGNGIWSCNGDLGISDVDDIDTEISDLRQKQKILEKAAYALQREEAYIALNAHSILNGAHASSKLWDEAKHFLDALQIETSAIDDGGACGASPIRDSVGTIESIVPASKRPRIDTAMVEHFRAGSFPGTVVTSHLAKESPVDTSLLNGPTIDVALQFTSVAQ
jgi:hypothetical protein